MIFHAAQTVLASGLTDILRKTYPVQPWWDVLRYVDALLTVALCLMYLRIAFGTERPNTTAEERKTIQIGICSYLCALIPSALTEVASIGQPIVPWRLPLFLLMNFWGWWYVRRRL